jgi:hypothetical protein
MSSLPVASIAAAPPAPCLRPEVVERHAHGVDVLDTRVVAVLRQLRVDITALPRGSLANVVQATSTTACQERELGVALVLETSWPCRAVVCVDRLASLGRRHVRPPLGDQGAHLRSRRWHNISCVGEVLPVRQLELQRHGDVLPVEDVGLTVA